MESIKYFWDTYAIIELIGGSPNYARFTDQPVICTVFNLVELYWSALGQYSEKKALEIFDKFRDAVVDVDDETLKEAMKFRRRNKKRRLSYADCIGYVYAQRKGMTFLTGDKEFESLPDVEFVK